VSHTQLVPTMFSRMLKLSVEVRHRYDVTSLEIAIHAAAPCPLPVKDPDKTKEARSPDGTMSRSVMSAMSTRTGMFI